MSEADAGLDVGELQAAIDAAIASNEAPLQRESERLERERAELEEPLKAIEEERRSGRAGRDWQVLQQRIDLGQTTFQDVVSGVDQSDEAKAAREQLSAQLPAARQRFVEALKDPEEEAVVDDISAPGRARGVGRGAAAAAEGAVSGAARPRHSAVFVTGW